MAASLIGMVAAIAVGIGIQGVVSGGSARSLGIATIALAFLVAAKCFAVTANITAADSPSPSVGPAGGPGGVRKLVTTPWRWMVRSRTIGPVTLLAWFALAAMAAFDIHLTAEPVPTFTSAYDGVDPVAGGCSPGQGKGTIVTASRVFIGRQLAGKLELEYSGYCGAHWARLYLDPPFMEKAIGSILHLTVTRPVDDQVSAYSVYVSRQQSGAPPPPYAWGNMTGGGVCAIASAQDNGRRGFSGFSAKTSCGSLPPAPRHTHS